MRNNQCVDYLIIGAGPGGLQFGYELGQQGLRYLILEAGDGPGTFFQTFPRHRRLISVNKVHTGESNPLLNLRWDWNSLLTRGQEHLFKNYSTEYYPPAADMLRYLDDYARELQINVQYETTVRRIHRTDRFTLYDQHDNVYTAERLVIATGLSTPYVPSIPGIEHAELYPTFSVDPTDFIDQRVLIIGKANSAFETADNLIPVAATIHMCSPHPVSLAWRTHFVGHLRSTNNDFLDTYQLKLQNGVLDAEIDNIQKVDGCYRVDITYTHAMEEQRTIVYDRILLCTGFRFDDSSFDDSCHPELTINKRFPNQTHEWESANVEDMYFAGTLMQARDYKKTMSAFVHGFRYNVKALATIFAIKYHAGHWPHRLLSSRPDVVTAETMCRINTSSSLFLQPGYFCDLLRVSPLREQIEYYEDLPVDYVLGGTLSIDADCFLLTLEYGDFKSVRDPFAIDRNPSKPETTEYLHPIVRRYVGRELASIHHVAEDLENVYEGEKFSAPLREYFAQNLASGSRLTESWH